jgi:two-component system response regulator FixJ
VRSLPVIINTGRGDVPLPWKPSSRGRSIFSPFEDEQLMGAIRTALEQGEYIAKSEAIASNLSSRIAGLSQRER